MGVGVGDGVGVGVGVGDTVGVGVTVGVGDTVGVGNTVGVGVIVGVGVTDGGAGAGVAVGVGAGGAGDEVGVGDGGGEAVGAERAACDSATLWPATIKPPLRTSPLFDCTVKETRPVPLPACPEVIVTHATVELAAQAQSPGAVTVT